MAIGFQVAMDCADPRTLAEFWVAALDYHVPPPPGDFETWEDFLTANGVPPREQDRAYAIEDPDGVGPRLFFQKVPEDKVGKNRLHLDLRMAPPDLRGDARMAALESAADRLVTLGAARLERFEPGGIDSGWLVMADPEGNEFCLT